MWSRVFDRRTNGVIGWHIKCQMLTLFCLPDILPVDTNLFLHFYSHFFLTNCDSSKLLAACGGALILCEWRIVPPAAQSATHKKPLRTAAGSEESRRVTATFSERPSADDLVILF